MSSFQRSSSSNKEKKRLRNKRDRERRKNETPQQREARLAKRRVKDATRREACHVSAPDSRSMTLLDHTWPYHDHTSQLTQARPINTLHSTSFFIFNCIAAVILCVGIVNFITLNEVLTGTQATDGGELRWVVCAKGSLRAGQLARRCLRS